MHQLIHVDIFRAYAIRPYKRIGKMRTFIKRKTFSFSSVFSSFIRIFCTFAPIVGNKLIPKQKRPEMKTKLYTQGMFSRLSRRGNSFACFFSSLYAYVLSIIKVYNLHIISRLLPPQFQQDLLRIDKHADALLHCARRHTKHFLVPVCRLCRFTGFITT